jgi:hypothetical protein
LTILSEYDKIITIGDFMCNFDEEKENLVKMLSEQYSQNIINMEEYERILEYINKIETKKEINIIEKIILENNNNENEIVVKNNTGIITPKAGEKHLAFFSWRTTNVEPIDGKGGKYTSFFGGHRIIVNNLPKGKIILNVNSIFGLTEIIVSQKIKIINKAVPIFSGIFTPNEIKQEGEKLPELYIIGKAIFGNITVKTIEE